MILCVAPSMYTQPTYGGELRNPQDPGTGVRTMLHSDSFSKLKSASGDKAAISPAVKRVNSSPTIQSVAEGDGISLSSADSKKRNKLGYHRTAVACGHCRRRKIRCIPSTDTTSSRCQNCIRLKKECQFYPVDQTTASTRKGRSESKADASGTEPDVSVGSSSPGAGAMEAHEGSSGQRQSPSQMPYGQMINAGNEMESAHNLDKWEAMRMANNAVNAYANERSNLEMLPPAFWPSNEYGATGGYNTSPFPMYAQSPATMYPDMQYPYSSPDMGESRYALARHNSESMSGMSSDMMAGQQSYRAHNYADIDRRMSMPETQQHQNMHQAGLNISMNPPFAYGGGMTYPYVQQGSMTPSFMTGGQEQWMNSPQAQNQQQQQSPISTGHVPIPKQSKKKFNPA